MLQCKALTTYVELNMLAVAPSLQSLRRPICRQIGTTFCRGLMEDRRREWYSERQDDCTRPTGLPFESNCITTVRPSCNTVPQYTARILQLRAVQRQHLHDGFWLRYGTVGNGQDNIGPSPDCDNPHFGRHCMRQVDVNVATPPTSDHSRITRQVRVTMGYPRVPGITAVQGS